MTIRFASIFVLMWVTTKFFPDSKGLHMRKSVYDRLIYLVSCVDIELQVGYNWLRTTTRSDQ
jgi:hypothetical protein